MTELKTIDIDTMPAGREMDAFVAEKVMGLQVLGNAHCACPEGDWYICGTQKDYTGDYGTIRPVYLRKCGCDGAKKSNAELVKDNPELADTMKEKEIDDIVHGHISYACLEVVPEYSTSIAAAWEVAEKLRKSHCCVIVFSDYDFIWEVRLIVPEGDHKPYVVETDETAPGAICRAALKANQ